jgi:coenzyme PQQ synthesis protein D (PqqD)
MKTTQPQAPQARSEGLVVQELADEIVIYDLHRHRSHCLNRMAALVWRRCDGCTSVAEIARWLHQTSSVPVDEEAVWLALDRLSKAHLLQQRVHRPECRDRATRRAMLRHLAAVGGVALVSSIVVPGALAAGSPTVPPQCITQCCAGDCSACSSSCNSCKCCFIGATQTVQTCSADCGTECQQLGGTCYTHFCA